jgi:thymidylate synthase
VRNYLDLVARVLAVGERREDRTGHGTLSLFGEQLQFDLREGFPAVTTKKLGFAQAAAELACFLRGYTTLEQFHSLGCRLWDKNGTAPLWEQRCREVGWPQGYLGKIYGAQWRDWRGTDQLRAVLDTLKNDPWSRRGLVTAYDPDEPACLPPCHHSFQLSARRRLCFSGESRWELDCLFSMRSVDLMLGLPFDVVSYALLTHLCAQELGMEPGLLTASLADAHVYLNHLDQARVQLEREPYQPPLLELLPGATVDSFDPATARLLSYSHHPAIKVEINV